MLALFKFAPRHYVTLVDRRRLREGWTQENVGFMKDGLEIVEATAEPRDMLDLEYPSTAYGIKVGDRRTIFTGAEAPGYLGVLLHRLSQGSRGYGLNVWPVVEGAFTFVNRDSVWAVVNYSSSDEHNDRALVFYGRRLNLQYTGAWQPSFDGLTEVVVFLDHDDLEDPYNEEELKALNVPIKDAEGKPLFAAV